jgi:hypothetical protein
VPKTVIHIFHDDPDSGKTLLTAKTDAKRAGQKKPALRRAFPGAFVV